MTTLSFAETTKLYQNKLVQGIAANIIEVNPILATLPVQPIAGNAITVNYEDVLGGVAYVGVNEAVPAGALTDATVGQKTFNLKKIIGEAQIDGLVEVTSASAGVDQMALQIASKAKNIGRKHADALVNGSTTKSINSFKSLVGPGLDVDGNATLSFGLLRELLDLVTSKDGEVDFLMMSAAAVRKVQALYDSLGGTAPVHVLTNPFTGETRSVLAFEGIPIFKNTFAKNTEMATGVLPNEAAFTASTKTSIYAGNYDDGSQKVGVSFIYAGNVPAAGLQVKNIGELEGYDARANRITQYVELANFSNKSLARVYNVSL